MNTKIGVIGIILIVIILTIGTYILNKRDINREKLSIYECGFTAFEDSRQTMYIKYYIVGIIFLIFDLETMLIYPFSYIIDSISTLGFIIFFIFFIILIYGLILELKRGLL